MVVLASGLAPAAALSQTPRLVAPTVSNPYSELLQPTPEPLPTPAEPTPAEPTGDAAPASEPLPPDAPIEPIPAAAGPDASIAGVAPIAVDESVDEPILHWYQPAYWFGPTPWDSGIELGMNGSSGTSDSFSLRTGGYMKRKADDYKFDGSLYYNKNHSNGVEVQSNALLDLRYDWLFDDSPWTLFVMSQTFYDEFQAFDVNFNVNTGFGYTWLDTDVTKFTTSMGTGASREFGGPGSEWVQEASFSFKFERQIADNHKFYAKSDFFPEWEDFNNHRVLTDVGFEFELHQPSNMSLKLSATDRYDSEPQGAQPHNLNYSALLIWKL